MIEILGGYCFCKASSSGGGDDGGMYLKCQSNSPIWLIFRNFDMWCGRSVMVKVGCFLSVFNEDFGSGERFDRLEGLNVRSDRQSGGGGAVICTENVEAICQYG